MHDENKLRDTFIPHLYERAEKGELILFTGAGFCQGMKTTVGGEVPSRKQLTKLLWNLCYGNEEQDSESELKDLFEQALKTRKNDLQLLFSTQFSINPNSIPDWAARYATFPWYKTYTVNIDNFWDAAANYLNLKRTPKSISAITALAGESNINISKFLPAISLNGDARDGPDKVTFSIRQYADRTSTPDTWLQTFASEQIAKTILYVGTALEEPSFWHYMQLRGKRGPRGTNERRFRSYIVSPNLPRARQAVLSTDFNIEWLKMTAEEFSECILRELEPAAAQGYSSLESIDINEHGTKKLPEVSDYLTGTGTSSLYLMGNEPEWPDILNQYSAKREEDDDLLAAIKTEISRPEQKAPIIITGTAGCGKSSTMMRVAHGLAAEGRKIGWVSRNLEISPLDLQNAAAEEIAPHIIFIEYAARYRRALQSLIYNLSTTEPFPLIISEIRSNVVDSLLDQNVFGKSKPIEVISKPLQDRDIDNILDVLKRESMLGKLSNKSRNEQIAAFREKAGRELLVAMYEATTGNRFKTKMIEEYDQLQGVQKDLYGAASLATHDGFDLSTEELFVCVGGDMNIVLNELEKLKNRWLIVSVKNKPGYYRTRHKLIADEVSKRMRELGASTPIIKGLVLGAAAKVFPDSRRGTRPMRILQRFLNHEKLYKFGSLELAREVYSDLQINLQWNLDYWLQRGLLELKCPGGSLEMAELYIANALGISDSHPLTRTEAAVLKMEKAIRTSGSGDANSLFHEGYNEIINIIDEGKFRREYPYHILGDKGLKWAKYGISDANQRREFLRELNNRLQHGIQATANNLAVTEMAQNG